MTGALSANTQATLLLTAPLIVSGGGTTEDLLTHREFKLLSRLFRDRQRAPADLIGADADSIIDESGGRFDADRIKRLLARGFALSEAAERWETRSIWVVSLFDDGYPDRVLTRLGEDSPPLLYGCGDRSGLGLGGLAVVGSRDANETLIAYTADVGHRVASAGQALISGGARGIDQAAMRGALEAGGTVVGVLADGLERAAMKREHRDLLMDGQMVLVSPYDPSVGFNVGHAMQRNKMIYALSDAALVVSSDYETGGTWAGAVEQLEKLHLVPVYVRATGVIGEGLLGLQRKGALPWPEPSTPDEFGRALAAVPEDVGRGQLSLGL